jgi:hypothetical protein
MGSSGCLLATRRNSRPTITQVDTDYCPTYIFGEINKHLQETLTNATIECTATPVFTAPTQRTAWNAVYSETRLVEIDVRVANSGT